jgi:FkbM family methyltransferase
MFLSRLRTICDHFAQDLKSMWAIPGMPYSFKERVSLVISRRSHRQESKFLNFSMKHLGETSFKTVLSEVFFQGEYRFEAATDAPLILDCGANIGMATLFFKYLYPNARIKAFEAEPMTAAVLQENVSANRLTNISVHNLMLADSEGERAFYTDERQEGTLKASFDPARVSNSKQVLIQAARLSSFIDGPVDLLKLDVEGAEFEVLADLRRSGKLSMVRQMIIEYHHKIGGQDSRLSSFLSQLEEEGFEYQISSGGCEPITKRDVYQDVVLGVYRRNSSAHR